MEKEKMFNDEINRAMEKLFDASTIEILKDYPYALQCACIDSGCFYLRLKEEIAGSKNIYFSAAKPVNKKWVILEVCNQKDLSFKCSLEMPVSNILSAQENPRHFE